MQNMHQYIPTHHFCLFHLYIQQDRPPVVLPNVPSQSLLYWFLCNISIMSSCYFSPSFKFIFVIRQTFSAAAQSRKFCSLCCQNHIHSILLPDLIINLHLRKFKFIDLLVCRQSMAAPTQQIRSCKPVPFFSILSCSSALYKNSPGRSAGTETVFYFAFTASINRRKAARPSASFL